MMCEFCRQTMAPRSRDQLDNRLNKMVLFPDVKLMPCPRCGGIEWATTEEMIRPVEKRPSFLRRLLGT